MSLRTARLLAVAYFLVMLAAVVWPGAMAASRVEPRILGLPFSFAWPALWVAGSVAVLAWLDRLEARHRDGGPDAPPGPGRPGEPEPRNGTERPGRTGARPEGRDGTELDPRQAEGEWPDSPAPDSGPNGVG